MYNMIKRELNQIDTTNKKLMQCYINLLKISYL